MTSKTFIAALIGGVVAFLLGYLIYGMALMNFMAANAGSATGVMKTEMSSTNMIHIFIGNLAGAFLLAYIFDVWANIRTFSGGAQAGALIGFLMALSFDFVMLGTSNIMNFKGTIVDIFASAIMVALVGGVVGWWLGRSK
ncbi:MAG: hypothetical protein ABI761_07450 [Saprospiraceae bacterium]